MYFCFRVSATLVHWFQKSITESDFYWKLIAIEGSKVEYLMLWLWNFKASYNFATRCLHLDIYQLQLMLKNSCEMWAYHFHYFSSHLKLAKTFLSHWDLSTSIVYYASHLSTETHKYILNRHNRENYQIEYILLCDAVVFLRMCEEE